jgi:hypothetical protein
VRLIEVGLDHFRNLASVTLEVSPAGAVLVGYEARGLDRLWCRAFSGRGSCGVWNGSKPEGGCGSRSSDTTGFA